MLPLRLLGKSWTVLDRDFSPQRREEIEILSSQDSRQRDPQKP
jgi:hypothetical protein